MNMGYVSFKSVRHLQEYMADFMHFYSRCVTFFLTMTRSLRCTCTKRSFGKASKSYSSRSLSPVSQNLPIESLNQFYIFSKLRKCRSYTPLIFASLWKAFAFESKVPYWVTSKNFVDFHCAATQIFNQNVLIWSKTSQHLMETTGWYLSIDMFFVLVHCCIGILMTSSLRGATAILGRKRITLLRWLLKHGTGRNTERNTEHGTEYGTEYGTRNGIRNTEHGTEYGTWNGIRNIGRNKKYKNTERSFKIMNKKQ